MKIFIDGKEQGGSGGGGGGGGGSDYAKGIQVDGKIIAFDVDDNDLPVFEGTYWQAMQVGDKLVKVLMTDSEQ